MRLIPPSSTALSTRPASSSSIAGPRGWPRNSMAPYPRMVTCVSVRPSGRVSRVMMATLPSGPPRVPLRSSGDDLAGGLLAVRNQDRVGPDGPVGAAGPGGRGAHDAGHDGEIQGGVEPGAEGRG